MGVVNALKPRSHTADTGIIESILKNNCYHLPASISSEGVCIDVGMHIGAFTHACLERGAKQVWGFEPDIGNFNLARQGLQQFENRAQLFNAAIGRSDVDPVRIVYFTAMQNTWNTGGGHIRSTTGIPVLVIRLDDILRLAQFCPVLKITAEGTEFSILYTATELQRVKRLICKFQEYDPHALSPDLLVENRALSGQHLARYLRGLGFAVEIPKSTGGCLFAEKVSETDVNQVVIPQPAKIQSLLPPKKVLTQPGTALTTGVQRKREVPVKAVPKEVKKKRVERTLVLPTLPLIPKLVESTTPYVFAWSSPYGGFWAEHYYRLSGGVDIYKRKVHSLQQFKEFADNKKQWPELFMMGNFVDARKEIFSFCTENGINVVCGEDGFFPHYPTMHADPLGFCWESSLPKLIFKECTDKQRQTACACRIKWLETADSAIHKDIQPPFVLWPLQLLGDQVNRRSLNLSSWHGIIEHFRKLLPAEIQLVIKPHPRSMKQTESALAAKLLNTFALTEKAPLAPLLRRCIAVAGANSTVLMEARLMFNKPVYCYAPSWYTNHTELFYPVDRKDTQLKYLDKLETKDKMVETQDYADWFLYQLLRRQYVQAEAQQDKAKFIAWLHYLTWQSYKQHGEEIFL